MKFVCDLLNRGAGCPKSPHAERVFDLSVALTQAALAGTTGMEAEDMTVLETEGTEETLGVGGVAVGLRIPTRSAGPGPTAPPFGLRPKTAPTYPSRRLILTKTAGRSRLGAWDPMSCLVRTAEHYGGR